MTIEARAFRLGGDDGTPIAAYRRAGKSVV